MPPIKGTRTPEADDIEILTRHINVETLAYGQAQPFAFFIKEDNTIIAGANGFVLYGSIYTDQLWVAKQVRGKGFARAIMEKVHALGKQEGCHIATIQTMSFQNAQGFYEKLGYVVDFKRKGYVKNSHCIWMQKAL